MRFNTENNVGNTEDAQCLNPADFIPSAWSCHVFAVKSGADHSASGKHFFFFFHTHYNTRLLLTLILCESINMPSSSNKAIGRRDPPISPQQMEKSTHGSLLLVYLLTF